MSTKELGEHFDIHGGGLDLKFPHHENEIAQTCGATHGRFAEIWMHTGFLNIEEKKLELIGEVRGEDINFIAGGLEYSGKINGKLLELH